jgi:DNA-binding transcriptional regulator YiaG
MKTRCYNTKSPDYKNYGGRGIRICNEWRDDYLSFFDWAMGNGYSDNLTIDRINNDGNYEPSNCRWATYMEQRHNQRSFKPEERYMWKNMDIVAAIKDAGLYQYQVAKLCNINKSTLVKWLKNELTPEKRERILNAIGRKE